MNLTTRIQALVYLGKQIELKEEQLLAAQQFVQHKNNWFTPKNTDLALTNIAHHFLQKEKLEAWAQQYEVGEKTIAKNIGIIAAGSPPLAGFHDVLSVFLSGHHAQIKLAEDDNFLMPQLIKIMQEGFEEVGTYFSFVERMKDFDAIITSGNQDSTKAFETYFSKFPNLIRKFKTGVAVLFGNESKEELSQFGKDIFQYFGLSSRSVSKIFVPKDYDFIPLLEATHEYNQIVLNNKYKNNFDFNYTLQIINKMDYKANGCIMIIEDEALQSRIAMLHYEVFEDEKHLADLLKKQQAQIQHIISNATASTFPNFKNKNFGEANLVTLTDYENEIDVMEFVNQLSKPTDL